MPKPKKPSAPPAKPRILDPGTAKRLAQGKPISQPFPQNPGGPSIPIASSNPTINPEFADLGPSLAEKKRPLRTLITNLRDRYSSLPRPARGTFRFLRIFGTAFTIGLYFTEHVAQLLPVRGPSMTPYLNKDYDTNHTKKDVVLVRMWPWGVWAWERQRILERGMLVTFRYEGFFFFFWFFAMLITRLMLFRSPTNSNDIAIKRIVGLPGDRIKTREPSLKSTQIVPFGHVWVEGDAEDPHKTLDSNTYGPVSISLLMGRVVAVLGPRPRWLNWTDWEGTSDDGSSKDGSGSAYRQNVRDRVVKDAVRIDQPPLG